MYTHIHICIFNAHLESSWCIYIYIYIYILYIWIYIYKSIAHTWMRTLSQIDMGAIQPFAQRHENFALALCLVAATCCVSIHAKSEILKPSFSLIGVGRFVILGGFAYVHFWNMGVEEKERTACLQSPHCAHAQTHTHTLSHTRTHTYTNTQTQTHRHTQMTCLQCPHCTGTRTYTHKHSHTHTHTLKHTHTHTHTHPQMTCLQCLCGRKSGLIVRRRLFVWRLRLWHGTCGLYVYIEVYMSKCVNYMFTYTYIIISCVVASFSDN